MNLLAVSHSCVTAINQQLLAEVESLTGWNVTLLVPSQWRNEYQATITPTRWPGFKGHLVPVPVALSGNIILHAYRSMLRRMLCECRPDAIYVHHEPYAVATAQMYMANRLGPRAPIGFYSCQNLLKRYPVPFCWSEKFVFRSSSFALPISQDVERVLRAKGYEGPSTVMPLGFDSTVYRPRARATKLKAGLRHNRDEFLIGYVGRIVEEKGLTTVLKALSGLTDLPWRLIIVGAGPFEREFDVLARRLNIADRIQRLGYVPHAQTPEYLCALDLLVLASETRANWKEQFGRVLVEAMACGTPVLGSDSGEIPNLIRSTGGGLVFAEANPAAMAAALRRLMADSGLRSRLRQRGLDAARRYANPVLAEQFATTIERAVRQHGQRSVASTPPLATAQEALN